MIVQMAGIRNVSDAIKSVQCGVDIVGLLVGQKHESKDFITKELALEIKNKLPVGTLTTLITHLEDSEKIIDIARFIGVDYIQLHSYIQESEVEKIHKALPNIKLLRLVHISENGKIINNISKMKYVDFFFTDSINVKTNQFGGTGLMHDFKKDKELVENFNKPVFIAGGLNPDNVAEIIRLVKPYGVDTNSGCKAKNGFRDEEKMRAFVQNAKNALN